MRVSGDSADGTPYEKHVIIDATTGRQIDAWDDIHTAATNGTGRTLYSGNVTLTTTQGFIDARRPGIEVGLLPVVLLHAHRVETLLL